MRKQIITLVLFSAWLSTPVLAKNAYVDYKCYLDTTKGKQLVFFTWKKGKAKANKVNLLASNVVLQGGQDARVKDVIECKKVERRFRNKQARKLDESSMR